MIFTAYIDESDSHGSEPNLVMSALLGTARQWALFERKLKRLQKQEGFTIFRLQEFQSRTGPFKGWDSEKRDRVGWAFLNLTITELTRGVTVVVPYDMYRNDYRAPPSHPKMPLDSQYGLCFRMCLYHFIDLLMVEGKNDRLDVVIEDGHKNVQDTVRIFAETKGLLAKAGVDFLRTITVSKKGQAFPLMAADFNAHVGALTYRAGEFDDEGDTVDTKKAFHTRLLPTPEYLREIKEKWTFRRDKQIQERRSSMAVHKAGSN